MKRTGSPPSSPKSTASAATPKKPADGLIIRPAALHGGVVHSYADHRMATAGAILGLAVAGVEVEDIATTAKTMPDFPQLWEAMLAQGPAADEDTAGGTQH